MSCLTLSQMTASTDPRGSRSLCFRMHHAYEPQGTQTIVHAPACFAGRSMRFHEQATICMQSCRAQSRFLPDWAIQKCLMTSIRCVTKRYDIAFVQFQISFYPPSTTPFVCIHCCFQDLTTGRYHLHHSIHTPSAWRPFAGRYRFAVSIFQNDLQPIRASRLFWTSIISYEGKDNIQE